MPKAKAAPKKPRGKKTASANPATVTYPAPLLKRLWQWKEYKELLAEVKDKEANLRVELFRMFFPKNQEGTETVPLPDGWSLKGVGKLSRDIDEAALAPCIEKLPAGSEPWLIKRKPELILANYRTLPAELLEIFNGCVITKPGMPAMELVPPPEASS